MKQQHSQITYLDYTRLFRAIVAGIRTVISSQNYLNKINVFPVPDGDTGTNMALTLNAILNSTYNRDHQTIHEYLDCVSEAALDGARGNSGTILAQFFLGFSEAASAVTTRFTLQNFVAAISHASNMAHRALSEPKEGTILTVIRDFSDELTQQVMSTKQHDFRSLLNAGLNKSKESLNNTTQQLPELKKAGVVDAGAQGFVNFLQGIHDFIETGSVDELHEPLTEQDSATEPAVQHNTNEEFRYCTECIIKDDQIDHHQLREEINPLGNCVIVAGSSRIAKIHIHTNEPKKIFEIASQHGTLSREKADDMLMQQHSVMHIDQKVAILTDSSADFPQQKTSSLNIHVVPLSLTLDGKNHLDKVSISAAEFYEQLPNTSTFPSTSQPSMGDFKRQYKFLSTHYKSIIAIHIPAGISGTISASKTAAKSISDNITVVDGMNVCAGLGLITSVAAQAAAAGHTHEKVLEIIKEAIEKTKSFVIIKDISYAVKGGRLSPKKKLLLDLLKINPILTFNKEGKGSVIGLTKIKNNLVKQTFKRLNKMIDKQKRYRINIMHTNIPEEANELKKLVIASFSNATEVEAITCSAVIGAHIGPGSLGVSLQEEILF